MKARLALAVSGTRCELREVRLSAKPPALLAASSKGTVPVLVRPDGLVIDESLHIMRWALARDDPETWLARDDAVLIDANDGAFKQDLDRYLYPDRHTSDPLAHRESGLTFLQEIDARLAVYGQLGGSRRGLADAAIMPFVRQFAAVDQEWFDTQAPPHVRACLNDHLASDLFQATMVRVEPWSPGDQPIYLPTYTRSAPTSGGRALSHPTGGVERDDGDQA